MWRDGQYVIGQCKRYKGTVPIAQVRDFYGAMLHVGAKRGYFFTTGRFSDGAYRFVEGKPIELLDGPYLQNILNRLSMGLEG
jgi:restriction system protein